MNANDATYFTHVITERDPDAIVEMVESVPTTPPGQGYFSLIVRTRRTERVYTSVYDVAADYPHYTI